MEASVYGVQHTALDPGKRCKERVMDYGVGWQSLLTDPNGNSPANPEAAKMYEVDRKECGCLLLVDRC